MCNLNMSEHRRPGRLGSTTHQLLRQDRSGLRTADPPKATRRARPNFPQESVPRAAADVNAQSRTVLLIEEAA